MASISGTSSDSAGFLAALISFLTANATLVADEQAWTVAWQSGDSYVLTNAGRVASAPVYVGISLTGIVGGDTQPRLRFAGITTLVPSATSLNGHGGVSPQVSIFISDTTTTYWFTANKQRFVVLAKVDAVYQAAYGGLFLPYAWPEEYPRPFAVGGSVSLQNDGDAVTHSASEANEANRIFTHGLYDMRFAGDIYPALYILDPQGAWRSVNADARNDGGGVVMYPGSFGMDGGPWEIEDLSTTTSALLGYEDVYRNTGLCLDGSASLTPYTIVTVTPEQNTLGILDGVYAAPVGVSAENLIDVGGVNHIVIPNVYRTSRGEFAAFRQA